MLQYLGTCLAPNVPLDCLFLWNCRNVYKLSAVGIVKGALYPWKCVISVQK